MLQVQAGTGLSTRLRGEANDFNLITADGDTVSVERFVAEAERTSFDRLAAVRFRRTAGRWEGETSGAAADAGTEAGATPPHRKARKTSTERLRRVRGRRKA
jgi:hypothetical protein